MFNTWRKWPLASVHCWERLCNLQLAVPGWPTQVGNTHRLQLPDVRQNLEFPKGRFPSTSRNFFFLEDDVRMRGSNVMTVAVQTRELGVCPVVFLVLFTGRADSEGYL